MLNLSAKASKHFKFNHQGLPSRDGDFWRIDVFYHDRLKYLICVHEKTLWSIIVHATDFKTPESLYHFIKEECVWYDQPLSIGKSSNRSVTGSIVDMRNMIKYSEPETITEMEHIINDCPFSYIGYKTPQSALSEYESA